MSKRTRTRAGHSNPTKEKNRRKERINQRGFTAYQDAFHGVGINVSKIRNRYKELRILKGLL
jgi:hypothetical protein